MNALKGNDWAEFNPPWAKVSEISEFLNLSGYELSYYTKLTSVYIHTDRRFRIQRSNQVIKGNSNKLHLD